MNKLLNPDQLCALLGISKKTLYGWTCRREIPFVKVGSLLRFRREEIDQWLEANEVPVFNPKEYAAQVADRLGI